MRYAFIDECGSVALFLLADPILVLAAVVTDSPRRLEIIARHAMRRLAQPRAEIKASQIDRTLLRWTLAAIAAEPLNIAYVCVDKRGATKAIRDPEELYRLAARQLTAKCLMRWPALSVVFDRRYTEPYLRERLDLSVRSGLPDSHNTTVSIFQEDSIRRKELQVADCVAWTIARWLRCGDNSLYSLIEDQVVFGEVINLS